LRDIVSTTTTDNEEDVPEAEQDVSPDGSMTPYTGSQLMDLPDGGSVVVDPDNYAAMVTQEPPTYRNHVSDPTDEANDYLDWKHYDQQHDKDVGDYKAFLHDNPGLRRGPRAPSYEDQFRAALGAGGAVPDASGAAIAATRGGTQPRSGDVQDLRNLAGSFGPSNTVSDGDMTVGPLQISHPGAAALSYEDRAHAALRQAGIDPSRYDDMQQTAAALQSPPATGGRAHAMLNFGADDSDLGGTADLDRAKDAPYPKTGYPSVEVPAITSRQDDLRDFYAKIPPSQMTPERKKEYAQRMSEAAKLDRIETDIERKRQNDYIKRYGFQATSDQKQPDHWYDVGTPAAHAGANFAIPAGDTDTAGDVAGAAVPGVASPSASYEDRVRAALASKPDAAATGSLPIGAAAGPAGLLSGGLQMPNFMAGSAPDIKAAISAAAPPKPTKDQEDFLKQNFAASLGLPDYKKAADAATADAMARAPEAPKAFDVDAVRGAISRAEGAAPGGKTNTPTVISPDDNPPLAHPDNATNLVTGSGKPAGADEAESYAPRYVQTPAVDLPTVNPKRSAQLQADTLAQGGPIQQEANAMSASARAESLLNYRVGQTEARNAAEGVGQEKMRAAKVDALMAQLQDQSEKISNEKIDPSRYWNSKDAGTKAINIIGLMLGGLAAGINGGKNPAMDYLNHQIDRDVDAQKANLANKRGKLDTTRNELELMRLQFGDQRQAEAAVKLSRINSLKAFVDAQRAKYQDPVFQARAAAVQAKLQVDADNIGVGMHKWINEGVVQTNPMGVAKDELFVPGVNGIANTPEDANTAKRILEAHDNAQRHIAMAIRLRQANAQTDPEKIPGLDQIQAFITQDLQDMTDRKRLSEQDIEQNVKMAGNLRKVLFAKGDDEALRRFQGEVTQRRNTSLKGMGLAGGRQGYDNTGVRRTYFTQHPASIPNSAVPDSGKTGFDNNIGN
jgi:hypothetical protein